MLPDNSDDKILECAISSDAEFIITYNIKHFPSNILKIYNTNALIPKTFLKKEKLL